MTEPSCDYGKELKVITSCGRSRAIPVAASSREVERWRSNVAEKVQASCLLVSFPEAKRPRLYKATNDLRSLGIALTVDLCLVEMRWRIRQTHLVRCPSKRCRNTMIGDDFSDSSLQFSV